ncbi:MAG: DUF1016 domain-containing protein [Ruminococcaceae bacterium]|jgi:hypothetical protein|nr:DUF1016 domain-containing protein [Oscillospiraceae bacterium]
MFPEIFHSVSGKSQVLLSWTHYRVLIQVQDNQAREALSAFRGRIKSRNRKAKTYILFAAPK